MEENSQSPEPADTVPQVPRGTETVLVVEDEDLVRELVREVLETEGYTVLVARSGSDALDICERHDGPVHLLITDVVMPEMGGRELSERLTQKCLNSKVLYMSGHADDVIVRHGVLEAGASFLRKPFTPNDLARKVRAVLDEE